MREEKTLQIFSILRFKLLYPRNQDGFVQSSHFRQADEGRCRRGDTFNRPGPTGNFLNINTRVQSLWHCFLSFAWELLWSKLFAENSRPFVRISSASAITAGSGRAFSRGRLFRRYWRSAGINPFLRLNLI